MTNMPDEASIRATPYESMRPTNQQVPAQYLDVGPEDPRADARAVPHYEQAMPNIGAAWPQEVSHENYLSASADNAVANGSDRTRRSAPFRLGYLSYHEERRQRKLCYDACRHVGTLCS